MLKKLLKSTFVRYMLSYILLTAVLVCSIMLYMYNYYRRSIYSSTISGETSLAYQLKYMTDGSMDSLSNFARRVSSLSESAAASELEGYEPAQGARTYVFYASSDRVATTDGGMDFEDFFQEFGADTNYDTLHDFVSGPEGVALLGARDIAADKSCVLAAAPLPSGQGSVFCILPESAFVVTDTRTDSTACNRYILKDNRLIVCTKNFDMPEERVLSAGANTRDVQTETRRLNGREYLFISVPGETGDTVYVSVLTLVGINTKAASLWLGFTAVLLLIALPCIGFMILISRRNLMPIQAMSRRFGKTGQNSDEISVISRGISELEDKNRELETRSLTARKHAFVKRLVRNEFGSADEARDEASALGIEIGCQYFAVYLVGAPRDRGQDVYLESVLAPAPEGVHCVGTDLLENEQILVTAFADEVRLLDEYSKALCALEQVRLLRIPVAVSAVHDDFSKLSTAFLEAVSAYECRFVMGDARLLSFSEIPFAAAKPVPGAQTHVRGIREALEAGDTERLNTCLGELNRYLRSEDMNLFTFRQVYNDIIGAVLSQAAGAGYTGKEIYDLFSLSGCRSLDELETVLKNVCEAVISARGTETRLPVIQEVIRLMTENYTNSDFTLSGAAEMAGVGAARLSAEFKNNMGMTPNDYLTMLRMEEAKKLLRQTDLPVGDVCGLSGYADASSFTRRFKQYTGSTPLNYRQNARSGPEATE